MTRDGIHILRLSLTAMLLFAMGRCGTGGSGSDLPGEGNDTEKLRVLQRERTVVLLPGGIIEQHGPYLPAFADGYANERMTQEIANAIVERPGWKVLVFPSSPLAPEVTTRSVSRTSSDGTYAVRSATLRAVFMDLATQLGEAGLPLDLRGPPPRGAESQSGA